MADFNPLCDKLLSQMLSFSDSKITLFSRNFMMKVCMMSSIAHESPMNDYLFESLRSVTLKFIAVSIPAI